MEKEGSARSARERGREELSFFFWDSDYLFEFARKKTGRGSHEQQDLPPRPGAKGCSGPLAMPCQPIESSRAAARSASTRSRTAHKASWKSSTTTLARAKAFACSVREVSIQLPSLTE